MSSEKQRDIQNSFSCFVAWVVKSDFSEEQLDSPMIFWSMVRQRGPLEDLGAFMGHCCAISHSSAAAERIFSSLSTVKTKLRTRLSDVTVSSIMHAKEFVRCSGGTPASVAIPKKLIESCQKWHEWGETVDDEVIDFVE